MGVGGGDRRQFAQVFDPSPHSTPPPTPLPSTAAAPSSLFVCEVGVQAETADRSRSSTRPTTRTVLGLWSGAPPPPGPLAPALAPAVGVSPLAARERETARPRAPVSKARASDASPKARA